jgi:hypothetical protein
MIAGLSETTGTNEKGELALVLSLVRLSKTWLLSPRKKPLARMGTDVTEIDIGTWWSGK